MPTPYLDWPALAEALEGRAVDEAAARRNLCHEDCRGEPPWLLATKNDGPDLEYRLVAPTGEGLLVTPAIVSLYDGTCQSTVEATFDRSGPVPTLSLHIAEEHVVPNRSCPPDEEVCDDTCATVEWDCRVRFVPQTLEIAIEDCVRGEPPPIIP
jgi:hypothetical protein